MRTKLFHLTCIIAVLSLLAACSPLTRQAAVNDGMYQVSGSFKVSNDFVIAEYMVEHAVALVDMHGFVIRDPEWEIPVNSQVLGYMKVDLENLNGAYDLNLPLRPEGVFNDVDNDGQTDSGVQIFTVAYWPNLAGGPFLEGDDRSFGWPTYLASVRSDPENEDEVIGGALVVWAADNKQQFPSGFGADGLLFTEDDPLGPIPTGYTIVNLDTNPFTMSQEANPELPLYEPKDIAVKDFSKLSYSGAFDKMFAIVRKEYAFNSIEGKQPNWDALYAGLKPRVEEAEENHDALAFYAALHSFRQAFKDGHVGLSSGDIGDQYFAEQYGGGYGFAIRELDDGRVIVIYASEGAPASQAGMQVGAEVTEFNGEPIKDAIGKAASFLSLSADFAIRYQQARYLLRAPLGAEAAVTFVNPGGKAQAVALQAVAEWDSFNYTSIRRGAEANALPVEYRLLAAGVGYIKINSNSDDLNLTIRLFERALEAFQARGVEGIIIDLRQNPGGAPLGLAGFLTDEEIIMGQLEYYSEKTGKFEPGGIPQKVLPMQNQYRFDKMALLVGQACFSACEIEAYGFSQAPGMIVVGEYSTAGTEAEVARGQFLMPEGFFLQAPTGRFVMPDGSLFLEGVGVIPDVRVPIDESTALSVEDEVLKAGERAVLQPLGMDIAPSGPPQIGNASRSEAALQAGAAYLEDKARETYADDELSQVGKTYTYTVPISESETLLWMNGWCASTAEILAENYQHIRLEFSLNGEGVPLDQLTPLETKPPDTENYCRLHYTALSDWPAGEHHLSVEVTFDQAINDGASDYPAGTHVYKYIVYVKP